MQGSRTLTKAWERVGRNARAAAARANARIGAFITREARRRAPRRRGKLRKSLNYVSDFEAVVIQSPLRYAKAQNDGALIKGGSARSRISPKPKLLAIPLNEKARRMADKLGASTSLRSLDLVLIKTKAGKMLLAKVPKTKKGRRRKTRKPIEFLFVLKDSTKLSPNPPPKGYIPSITEPKIRAFVVKTHRTEMARAARGAT